MSESIGDPAAFAPRVITATAPADELTVHEAYAFACLNCGYGWEQAYEIAHGTDTDGRPRSLYRANGVPVPSPLTRPSCPGCAGAHVRIMRAGRVAEATSYWHASRHPARPEARSEAARPEQAGSEQTGSGSEDVSHAPARPRREHRLHLPFHLHLRRNHHGTPEV
jgi:hypothetical protein